MMSMDRFLCADLAFQHFSGKQHTLEREGFVGSRVEYRTYEVQVAVFGENFNEPPVVKALRVRLSDDEYLRLLQWQLQNPATGFNACGVELSDIIGSIECQVEEKVFDEAEVGTYAIYLSEVRQDAAHILRKA